MLADGFPSNLGWVIDTPVNCLYSTKENEYHYQYDQIVFDF